MSILELIHGKKVHPHRVNVLSNFFSELIPVGASILDVGCGDGLFSRRLIDMRPDIRIEGIDVKVRSCSHIPVCEFDGQTIPFADKSVDAVLFVDVLHHAKDPMALLREAKRISRKAVLIKDHTRKGFLAYWRLRFMDWVGNARHGVCLLYDYWTQEEWELAFKDTGLYVDFWTADIRLYPRLVDPIFGASLHFIARLIP